MSNFNLGLEALADNPCDQTGDILSYEYLDTVMQFVGESQEAVVIADGIGSICIAFENLSAVCEVLETHGNTPALEALIGGNFREGFSLEAAESAKEGLWAKFVKWLKTLWAKIKAFFSKWTSSAEKMRTALLQRIRDIRENSMAEVEVKIPGVEALTPFISFIKGTLKPIIDNMKAAQKELGKGDLKSAQQKLEEKRDKEDNKTLFNAINDPAAFKVTPETACRVMEMIVDAIDKLKEYKRDVDELAADVERMSFGIDSKKAKAFAADNKEVVGTLAAVGSGQTEEKDVKRLTNNAGKALEAGANWAGSDQARTAIMSVHSWVTSQLNKCTTATVRIGSLCLSSFKVAKVAK